MRRPTWISRAAVYVIISRSRRILKSRHGLEEWLKRDPTPRASKYSPLQLKR